jgi:hypothetical protein
VGIESSLTFLFSDRYDADNEENKMDNDFHDEFTSVIRTPQKKIRSSSITSSSFLSPATPSSLRSITFDRKPEKLQIKISSKHRSTKQDMMRESYIAVSPLLSRVNKNCRNGKDICMRQEIGYVEEYFESKCQNTRGVSPVHISVRNDHSWKDVTICEHGNILSLCNNENNTLSVVSSHPQKCSKTTKLGHFFFEEYEFAFCMTFLF